jgi:hypothetical protein
MRKKQIGVSDTQKEADLNAYKEFKSSIKIS